MPLGGSQRHDRFFTGRYERRVIPLVGHNLPQEAPRGVRRRGVGVV